MIEWNIRKEVTNIVSAINWTNAQPPELDVIAENIEHNVNNTTTMPLIRLNDLCSMLRRENILALPIMRVYFNLRRDFAFLNIEYLISRFSIFCSFDESIHSKILPNDESAVRLTVFISGNFIDSKSEIKLALI